ncbi:MAG TPA: histidine kinase [Gemmatimonadales bacterium]|nr:histidine kinase [Gemmatimonadales bacterium]
MGQTTIVAGHPWPGPDDAPEAHRARPMNRSELIVNFVFWMSLATLVGGSALLLPIDLEPESRLRFVKLVFFVALVWSLATPPLFSLASRFGLEHGSRGTRILLFIAIAPVVALTITLLNAAGFTWILPPLPGEPTGWGRFRSLILPMLPGSVTMYAAVVGTGLARDASLRAQARREEAVRLQAHNAQLQAQLAEARLDLLRAQLNPHFLFNTLNAISGLMDEDPRGARRMVARLSELLRFALQGATDREIPLHEELGLLRRYLEIVEIRYQGRLQTEVAADPWVEEALVPSLILQPLAENAMKHGVAKAGGHGRIEVHARREGDGLVLTVRDTGPGDGGAATAPAEPGSGLGLRHVRDRLEELYGADQRFELRPAPDGGMIAEMVLPFHTRADLRAVEVPDHS